MAKKTEKQETTTKEQRMKESLEKQEKVLIYVPAGKEEVELNLEGYKVRVPNEVHIRVPEQVADRVSEYLNESVRVNIVDLEL